MKQVLMAVFLVWLGWLIFPPCNVYAQQTHFVTRVPATHLHGETAAVTREGVRKIACNKMYYRYLPGIVDYCLGLHDWQSGKYRSGLQLLKQAAGWGNKSAQYSLGLIYYNGHHVRTNRALGIAWLKLATERHDDERIDVMTQSAIRWATPAQRQHAQQLFQQMRKRYGDEVAAKRALRQFAHWKKYVAMQTVGGTGGGGAASCMMPNGSGGQMIQGRNSVVLLPHATEASADGMESAPPSNSSGSLYTGSCVPLTEVRDTVYRLANVYFQGWIGVVDVGPIEPAAAASSGK